MIQTSFHGGSVSCPRMNIDGKGISIYVKDQMGFETPPFCILCLWKFKSEAYLNKKGGEVSTFFAPNLTMNLTYLCYGKSKVGGHTSLKAINTMNCGNYR